MNHTSLSTRNDVLSALNKLLSDNKTGIFLIATLENASCRIALQNGEITHCVYKRLMGDNAIQALATCMGGTWSFVERGVSLFKTDSQVNHELALQVLELSPNKTLPHLVLNTPSVPQTLPAPKPSVRVNNVFYRGFTGATPAHTDLEAPANQSLGKVNNRFYRGS